MEISGFTKDIRGKDAKTGSRIREKGKLLSMYFLTIVLKLDIRGQHLRELHALHSLSMLKSLA